MTTDITEIGKRTGAVLNEKFIDEVDKVCQINRTEGYCVGFLLMLAIAVLCFIINHTSYNDIYHNIEDAKYEDQKVHILYQNDDETRQWYETDIPYKPFKD